MWNSRQHRLLQGWCLLLSILPLAGQGCGRSGPPVSVHTVREPAGAPAEEYLLPPPRYLLGPGDLLHISYLGEKDLDTNIRVSPDGRVLLPLLDDPVLASGLTLEELKAAVQDSLGRYLVDPQVFLHLVELGSQHVFVLGEVRNPQLARAEPLTLAAVIAACGGLTKDGQKKQVIVMRRVPGKEPVVFDVNFSHLLDGKSLLPDLPLQRYDIVVVPKSRVANVRDFMSAAFGNNLSALRFGIDAVVLENALHREYDLYYRN